MLRTKRRFFFLLSLGLAAVACQPDKPTHTEPQQPTPTDSTALDAAPDTGRLTALVSSSDTWHKLGRRTNLTAPLIVYRRGTLRAPSRDTTAPPPTDARLADLTLKASEYFQIDPTRPAEVRGREGTVVRIPAGALVDAQQARPSGSVWVELKECYTKADLVLSNLQTQTLDNELLETGGAVLVRATTYGQPLQLADGRTYQLELPVKRREPAMQLYYGLGRKQPTQWAAAETVETTPEQVFTDAERMPAYGRGPADINKLVRYPPEAVAKQTQGVVFASFVVDEAGRVTSPKILRGIGDGCDEEVLRVLRQTSGHWTPGQHDGQFVKVKMTLPIRFSFQPGMATTADSTSAALSVVAAEPSDAGASAAESPNSTQYVFTTKRLGWLTCARLWQSVSAKASLLVPAVADASTSVRLVFRGHKTVLEGQAQDNGYAFDNVPANQRATLVAMRYDNGIPYLALQETTTGQPLTEIQFKETTLDELERMLSKLN
ncbi:energy transducer TonB [Hymenobacter jejuensis]|uniref:Energy transducer TonB n=1 Tax=Hymenobacter jejuensis TaxID=2502781 RepID=A0A5B7ZXP8_9BACT|nr:energy transducer TonB [Hymenobacter jejuensis]QDA59951.1 energy transducer TonB [Hymenobacter jejuensis]